MTRERRRVDVGCRATATDDKRNPAANRVGGLDRISRHFLDTFIVTRRNLINFIRQPSLVVFSVIQPVIFLIVFTYVFGGAIKLVTGGDYISFLLTGIIIQTMVFASTNTAVGLALDLSLGLIQRFRSLPMSRAAVLPGRTSADTIRGALTILIMMAAGYMIGFRPDDRAGGLLGFLLAVAFGHAFTWIGAAIGLFLSSPESAQVAGFVWLVPVTFVSSIFIPPFTMPDWLRVFADKQPVSVVANATRGLMMGSPDIDTIGLSVVWIVGIMLVLVPLTVWEYARAVSQSPARE